MSKVTFIRNKLVTVEQAGPDTILVRALLADDIYALEVKISIRLPALDIAALEGCWNRWTTPECHRAIPELQQAVGLEIRAPGFNQAIKKGVGRRACRHFANLIIEGCDCARAAMAHLRPTAAPAAVEKPDTIPSAAPTEAPRGMRQRAAPPPPAALKRRGGCIIDLHTHTFPASPCSTADLEDLVREAKRIGLDGICLTDHNYRWDPEVVPRISAAHDFLILRGCEATTDQGDILVFGLEEDLPGVIALADLRQKAAAAGAFLIAAHPFRGFLTFGVGQLGLTVEKAMQRPLWHHVDAIETLNSKLTEKENTFAAEVARGLGLPMTGGSDAHAVSEVGVFATWFAEPLHNEADLLAALRTGRYEPVVFRPKE